MSERSEPNREPESSDRDADRREGSDADRGSGRTEAPRTDPSDAGIDPDAPGNFVDDTTSDSIPEPNEPG
jgi:hypothetical protein